VVTACDARVGITIPEKKVILSHKFVSLYYTILLEAPGMKGKSVQFSLIGSRAFPVTHRTVLAPATALRVDRQTLLVF